MPESLANMFSERKQDAEISRNVGSSTNIDVKLETSQYIQLYNSKLSRQSDWFTGSITRPRKLSKTPAPRRRDMSADSGSEKVEEEATEENVRLDANELI